MGTLHDINSGEKIDRTRFGDFLDAHVSNGMGVAWDMLPKKARRVAGTAATLAVAAASGITLAGYEANKDAAAHPEPDYAVCLPEAKVKAESGDTLKEMGISKLGQLQEAAAGQGIAVTNPDDHIAETFKKENIELNGNNSSVTAGMKYDLGRVCVNVVAPDGVPEYVVVRRQ